MALAEANGRCLLYLSSRCLFGVDKVIPIFQMRKPELRESTNFAKTLQFLKDFRHDFNLTFTD